MEGATIQRPHGLTAAEVRQRVAAGAVNRVEQAPSRTTSEIVKANVLTRFNLLLGVLLVILLVVVREPRDALFGIVLVTNAAIGIIQELRAKATLDHLALLTTPKARVVRDGKLTEVALDAVVEDDVLVVGSGDQIIVDGEVVAARGLEVDESLLTGESDPVSKEPGAEVLSGSFVAAGSGAYRATRVGEAAFAAKLAKEARRFTLVRSELREGIDWILGAIGWALGPVMALLVWSQLRAHDGFREAVRSAVAGAVGMIPQGLVLLTSIAFAVGVVRLGRRHVLVQELPAVEGLARVDTVCFDKTGTLTEGKLTLESVIPLRDGLDPGPALGALAAADPDPNATVRALADRTSDPGWQPTDTVPFSSDRKWSAASFAGHGHWALGAPEIVAPDDPEVAELATAEAAAARRTLVLARLRDAARPDRPLPEAEPVAIVSLGDRVRADAQDTIAFFTEQGVAAKVISGDHPETVGAIARRAGITHDGPPIDGRRLPDDSETLAEIMDRYAVFGRVTPHQKRAMVQALQRKGRVVAMTGDGVNDVLALKDADIGVAMGGGSSAARAVAQLVLIDGDFASLPHVVHEGRRVVANIERVANLFVTKAVYALFLAVVVGLAGRPFPFLPRHLTLVGSVTIGVPAFFLALAPSSRRIATGFIRRVLRFALPTGIAAGLATFAAYELAISEDVTLAEARTVATFVLAAIGLFALGIVSRPLYPWKRWLIASMAGLLVFAVLAPGPQRFFALDLPRPVVLLAAVGIVAITGALMVGTLQAVGWIRHVEEQWRASPPEPSRLLAGLNAGVESWLERLAPRRRGVAGSAWTTNDTPDDDADATNGADVEWIDPDEFLTDMATPERIGVDDRMSRSMPDDRDDQTR